MECFEVRRVPSLSLLPFVCAHARRLKRGGVTRVCFVRVCVRRDLIAEAMLDLPKLQSLRIHTNRAHESGDGEAEEESEGVARTRARCSKAGVTCGAPLGHPETLGSSTAGEAGLAFNCSLNAKPNTPCCAHASTQSA